MDNIGLIICFRALYLPLNDRYKHGYPMRKGKRDAFVEETFLVILRSSQLIYYYSKKTKKYHEISYIFHFSKTEKYVHEILKGLHTSNSKT